MQSTPTFTCTAQAWPELPDARVDDGGEGDQRQVGLAYAGWTRTRTRACVQTGGKIHLERDEEKQSEIKTKRGGSKCDYTGELLAERHDCIQSKHLLYSTVRRLTDFLCKVSLK